MTQKPLKRHPALVPLSREHHTDLLLVWKIREGLKKGVEPKRMGAYVHHLYGTVLRHHFLQEETYLFAPAGPEDDLVNLALEHHKELRRLIQQCDPSGHPDALGLEQLASLMETHVRFEERTLFPHLEQVLKPSQLQHLQDIQQTEAHAQQDEWEDGFWL